MTVVAIDAGRQPSRLELRAFAGLSMASAAISIDLILPAFGRIRSDLGLAPGSAATAGLVTAFFLGMALGPIPFGLLADRFGRRWVLLGTCALFVGGALGAAAVPSLRWMLWARFAWGLGAAGLRVIAVATIRDRFGGADMAREMAFAMTIFILVPVVAPALGAGLIKVMPWRGTFVVCAAFGAAIAVWSLRLPESLPVDRRQPLQLPSGVGGDSGDRAQPAGVAVHPGQRGALRRLLVVSRIVRARHRRGLRSPVVVPLHLRWNRHLDGDEFDGGRAQRRANRSRSTDPSVIDRLHGGCCRDVRPQSQRGRPAIAVAVPHPACPWCSSATTCCSPTSTPARWSRSAMLPGRPRRCTQR